MGGHLGRPWLLCLLALCVAGPGCHAGRGPRPPHFTPVATSPSDPRRAVHFVLPNGLPVVLISDPVGDMAGAALDVAVGALDDPADIPGLAHFTEHMVLLGSNKYPEEPDFKTFVQRHGGRRNGFTSEWHSNFFFMVGKDSLRGSLDRLAQCFVAPLLRNESAAREVDAVNSEYEKNLESSDSALAQLYKHLADPQHPFHMFTTGNLATLGQPGTIDRLRALFEKHYTSAAAMRLAVLGPASVEQLAEWVVHSFGTVPARPPAVPPRVTVPVWQQTGRLVRVQPLESLRQLHLVWALPPLLAEYRAMVPPFLAHVLEATGPGSLYRSLQARGWAERIHLDVQHVRDFTLMDLTLSLTGPGLQHYEDAARGVFAYLNLLRDRGLWCAAWRRKWEMEQLLFQYKEASTVDQFVSAVATAMQSQAPRDALGSPAAFQCDRPLLRTVLHRLTPHAALLFLVARGQEGLKEEEPLYRTKYAAADVPAATLAAWATERPWTGMALPGPNPYFPPHFRVFTPPQSTPALRVVRQDRGLAVWHQPSQLFALPKGIVACQAQYPAVVANLTAVTLLRLYAAMARDAAVAAVYDATQVGMDWSVDAADSALHVSISGFTASLTKLWHEVLAATHAPLVEGRFAVVRGDEVRALSNRRYEMGSTYTQDVLRPLVFDSPAYSPSERLEALRAATFPQLQQFAAALHHEPRRMDCLGFGNVEKLTVSALSRHASSVFPGHPLGASSSPPAHDSVLVPAGTDVAVEVPNPDRGDINSVVLSTFQFPAPASRDLLLVQLLEFIVSVPAYTRLRTQEQLGYIAATSVTVSHSHRWNVSMARLHFLVQSGDFSPEYLDERVEAFLTSIPAVLRQLSDADLRRIRKGMVEEKWPRPLNLQEEFSPRWQAVLSHRPTLVPRRERVALLRDITCHDLLAAAHAHLLDPAQRRKVAILLHGKGRPLRAPLTGSTPLALADLPEWKRRLLAPDRQPDP